MASRVVRVGVVAYEMEGRPSGVGRFLEGLLSGLAELAEAEEPTRGDLERWSFQLFFKGEPFEHPLFAARDRRGRLLFEPIFDRRPSWRPIAWEQLRLPTLLRAHGAGAVFSPGYSLPLLSDIPGFLTLHDLSFERRPEEFAPRERWRRRLLARWGARRAARVFASSRFGGDELMRLYGLARRRITLLSAAVAPRFAARPAEPEGEALALAGLGVRPPYLLWVGTLLPRRPIGWALAALGRERARHPELTLVIAGADRMPGHGAFAEELAASGVADAVVRLPFVPDALLPALYREAELTLYPSAYEGFGLPPLESLAAGTPAVTTPGQALDDLWPGDPYRAPFELEGFCAMVKTALADRRRDAVVTDGQARVATLSWRASAARLLATLAEELPA